MHHENFFKLFCYIFLLDLKKTVHVTEMRGIIIGFFLFFFMKSWDMMMTRIDETVIYLA